MVYTITKKITKFNQSGMKMKKIVGGIQHSTGNKHDHDEGNWNWFNSGDRKANAHFFIDENSITQCVDDLDLAWHARKPASYDRWGCEMCQTPYENEFKEIWKRQVWLWAYLFTQVAKPRITKITKETLRSHYEENLINHIGDKNNHTDPHAYFAKFGKTMNDMRKDVQKAINEILEKEKIVKEVIEMFKDLDKHWAKNDIEYVAQKGIIKGVKNNDGTLSFEPDKPISRAETSVIIARILRKLEELNIKI